MALMGYREVNEVLWVGSKPGHKWTQVSVSNESSAATAVLYTVTSGKTLFLKLVRYSPNSSVTGANTRLVVRNASDVVQYDLCNVFFDAVGQIAIVLMFDQPLEIPAGFDITMITDSANADNRAFISGGEE